MVRKIIPSGAMGALSVTVHGDGLGMTVAMEDDTLVIGSFRHDGPAGRDQGAAWVLYQHANGTDGWGEVAKLRASDGAA